MDATNDPTRGLRRLLDERGVEWVDGHVHWVNEPHERMTVFMDGNGRKVTVTQALNGLLVMGERTCLTPEQAVEAALGRSTCLYEITMNVVQGGIALDCAGAVCDHCGRTQIGLSLPKYCPDCGCEVMNG